MPLYVPDVVTTDDFAVNDIANYTHVGPGALGDFTIPGDGLLHAGVTNGSAIYRNDVLADVFRYRVTLDPANLDAAFFLLLRRESDGVWFIVNNPHTADWHYYSSADNGGSFADLGTKASANRLAIRSFEVEHSDGFMKTRTFDAAGAVIDPATNDVFAGWGAGQPMRPGFRINVPPGATMDRLQFTTLVPVTTGAVRRRGSRARSTRNARARSIRGVSPRKFGVGQVWPRGSRGR